ATGAAARAMETVGAPGEGLKIALAPKAAARPAETFKTLEARLALGVDLAAVEGLALVRLAQDLVGAVELGEAIGALGAVLVGCRMQLLGLLPERTLDLGRTRGLRHPQDVVGVAHRQSLPGRSPRSSMPGNAPPIGFKCGDRCRQLQPEKSGNPKG